MDELEIRVEPLTDPTHEFATRVTITNDIGREVAYDTTYLNPLNAAHFAIENHRGARKWPPAPEDDSTGHKLVNVTAVADRIADLEAELAELRS